MKLMRSYLAGWLFRLPHDARNHVVYLVLSSVMTVLPLFMNLAPEDHNQVRLAFVELPSLCFSRQLFHTTCPGCGLIRSFVLIAHGHWSESLQYHRLGLLVYAYLLYQVGFHGFGLRRLGEPMGARLVMFQNAASLGLIVLLIVNWLAGVVFDHG